MPWKRGRREHNEWFRPVSRGGRKSCSNCGAKLGAGESIWCCGAYVRAKWHNQFDCCKNCWPKWAEELLRHEQQCPEKCVINLVPYHCTLPAWMKIDRAGACCGQQTVEDVPSQHRPDDGTRRAQVGEEAPA